MASNEFLDTNIKSRQIHWWKIFRQSRLSWYTLMLFIGYLLLIIVSILFFDLNPYEQQSNEFFMRPNLSFSFRDGLGKFLLGTDDLGRDVYARLMYASKNTLLCAFCAATLSSIIGLFIGILSALNKNIFTRLIKNFIHTINSYTPIIFVFAIVTVLGPSLKNTLWAITVSLIPRFTSICYDLVNEELNKEYIRAVTLDGAKPTELFKLSILPNIRETLIAQYTKTITMAILDVTALGFLGLCVKEPEPELGNMIAENMDLLYTGNFWLMALPGVMIISSVIMINIVGDGIRNAMHKESS